MGKTMISLMAINELRYNRFEIGKVLVIAPKKVAEATCRTKLPVGEHEALAVFYRAWQSEQAYSGIMRVC